MRRTCTCGHRWVGFGQCGAPCPLLEPPQLGLEVVPSKSHAGPLDHNTHSVRMCLSKYTVHIATTLPRTQTLMPTKVCIAVLAATNKVCFNLRACAGCRHASDILLGALCLPLHACTCQDVLTMQNAALGSKPWLCNTKFAVATS